MCVELDFLGFKMYITPYVQVLVPYVYIRRMVKGQDSFIMYFLVRESDVCKILGGLS